MISVFLNNNQANMEMFSKNASIQGHKIFGELINLSQELMLNSEKLNRSNSNKNISHINISLHNYHQI